MEYGRLRRMTCYLASSGSAVTPSGQKQPHKETLQACDTSSLKTTAHISVFREQLRYALLITAHISDFSEQFSENSCATRC
jgi:hypothetical protein